MANVASIIMIGPFTLSNGSSVDIPNAAVRIRNVIPQPLNTTIPEYIPEVDEGETETSSPF